MDVPVTRRRMHARLTLLCVIIWKAERERERERLGYGTALYKAKRCKQTDDCTNSVNYEANEKLKGNSNEKFDQMLFRLSFQVIKWSGKKSSPRYVLACDLFHVEKKKCNKVRKE